ncbi:MAG: tetratricopeptide repeat protein [Thermodesulfovibrionales bacterium]
MICAIITPVGKASRNKKGSINKVPGDQGRHEKGLKPSQESPSIIALQKTASIITFIPILILLLISFVVYFNALFGDFVYDDISQIVNNPWITNIRNIPTIFSKSVWSFEELGTSNYYRPMMHIVYMLNYHLFGLKPWGFHLVNILFHFGASVLVFLVVRRLLTEHRDSMCSVYLSPPFIAAMLFASHPIHTEAVTWIAGLPDVAFSFFYLLSFYLYILFREGVKRGYLLSILSFSVATLFKEPALTLPIMLIAYDYLLKKSDETILAVIKRYMPYVAISGVYLLVRYSALRGFAPLESYSYLSTYQFIINVFPLFREYLTSMLWPFDLNLWHTFHPISSLFEAKGMISIVVAVLFFIGAVAAYRKDRVIFFSLLLVGVPLLPVFYIKAIGGKPFAERYLYLPSVGFVFLLAIFLSWAGEKLPRAVRSITIVFIVIGALYAGETIIRNNVWQDNFNLWSDTVKKSPDSEMAHHNLGLAYRSQGQLDKAIEEYLTALRLNPKNARVHNNIGAAYASQGQLDRAIAEYQIALRLKPGDAKAHNNLGAAYRSQGQLDRAIAEYSTALRLSPDYTDAHNNLGLAYRSQGQLDKAIAEYLTALRLKPDFVEAHNNLGVAYASQGQLDRAIAEFQTTLRLKPDLVEAHNNLGRAYASQGQLDRAIAEYQTALRLKPDFNEVRQRLSDIVSRRH